MPRWIQNVQTAQLVLLAVIKPKVAQPSVTLSAILVRLAKTEHILTLGVLAVRTPSVRHARTPTVLHAVGQANVPLVPLASTFPMDNVSKIVQKGTSTAHRRASRAVVNARRAPAKLRATHAPVISPLWVMGRVRARAYLERTRKQVPQIRV
jgi:hypothetical protein